MPTKRAVALYPSGFGEIAFGDLLPRARASIWHPAGNSATVPGVLGFPALTATTGATLTARGITTTSRATREKRIGYVSAATAAAFGGHFQATAAVSPGDGAGVGGFEYMCRFVPSDAATVSGARMFVGLRNAITQPTNVEPNSLTQCIGVAQLSTSTNMFIVLGGSAAGTAIDLGVNYPAAGLQTDLYDLRMWSLPSQANVIKYRIERVGTAFITEGTFAGVAGTSFPNSTTLLAHTAWRTNNATLLAVGLDIGLTTLEPLD